MPPLPRLPPGLTAIDAGRWGLWLLGKRSHIRYLKRTVTPARIRGHGLVHDMMQALMPWSVEEYPGYRKGLAFWCGVKVRTVEDWLYGKRPIPSKHAVTLAAIARTRAEQLNAVAAELEAYAAGRGSTGQLHAATWRRVRPALRRWKGSSDDGEV